MRPDAARRSAEPGTTSVARASSVVFADRCSVLRATPSPLAICVDAAARAAVPNAELAAVSAVTLLRDTAARAVCVIVAATVETAAAAAEVGREHALAAVSVPVVVWAAVAFWVTPPAAGSISTAAFSPVPPAVFEKPMVVAPGATVAA